MAAGFGLALATLAAVGALAYVNTARLSASQHFVIDTNRQVAHTHEVLSQLALVHSLLEEAETAQRGYILTGEESYIEPYRKAADEIGPALDRLKELTSDNASQQARLRDFQPKVRAKFSDLARLIEVRRGKDNGFEKALEEMKTDRGRKLLVELR